jgi:hypothetical protein
MEDLYWCTLEANSSNAETFHISKDSCTLGCSSDNNKVFNNNKFSGKHCAIKREKARENKWRYVVEDLSSNGTFVNGSKVGKGNKKEVHSGDEIALLRPDKQTENGIGTCYIIGGLIFTLKLTEEELFGGIKRDHREQDAVKEESKSPSIKRLKQDEEINVAGVLNEVEDQKKVVDEVQVPRPENKFFNNDSEEEKKSPKEESKAPNDTAYLNDIQCGICIDIMYQAVTLMPCLHNVRVGLKFSFAGLVFWSGWPYRHSVQHVGKKWSK